MTKAKIDPYEKLFISDSERLLKEAQKNMGKELCKCGHIYRMHDHYLNLCNAKSPNKRNTCECIEFRGKMSLIDFLIDVTRKDERKKILHQLEEMNK